MLRKLFVKLFRTGYSSGIGIDLGISEFAVLSSGKRYENFNRHDPLLMRLQKEYKCYIDMQLDLKAQDVKYKMIKRRKEIITNIVKQITNDYPKFITIETLNFYKVNPAIKKQINDLHYDFFRKVLTKECAKKGIQLRLAPRYFKSSKTCNKCKYVNEGLTLSDRVYICKNCRFECNRDLNAAFNLRDLEEYKILANK